MPRKTIIKKKIRVGKKSVRVAIVKKRIKIRAKNARKGRKIKKQTAPQLKKFVGNPIIEPEEQHPWESQYTFNPAAVYKNGKVHLVYRAIGNDGISLLGYASSKNGVHIDERLSEPIYVTKLPDRSKKESAVHYISTSGGSWGGCEDPRITEIDDTLYMTYTAFNGYPRVALTSIGTRDFLAKRWMWKGPVLISPPGEVHKNWVVFPEKINGRYAILHSISPEIIIDYYDSLDFDGKTYIESRHFSETQNGRWDSRMRGVGPPPIKTDCGWLIIYHAIDDRDPGKYKLGAMILDYKNPASVLYRSAGAILAPDEPYENEGFKAGIVYSCGAVVMNGELFVYYGGADSVVCVATANLNEFLKELKRTGLSKLDPISTILPPAI